MTSSSNCLALLQKAAFLKNCWIHQGIFAKLTKQQIEVSLTGQVMKHGSKRNTYKARKVFSRLRCKCTNRYISRPKHSISRVRNTWPIKILNKAFLYKIMHRHTSCQCFANDLHIKQTLYVKYSHRCSNTADVTNGMCFNGWWVYSEAVLMPWCVGLCIHVCSPMLPWSLLLTVTKSIEF